MLETIRYLLMNLHEFRDQIRPLSTVKEHIKLSTIFAYDELICVTFHLKMYPFVEPLTPSYAALKVSVPAYRGNPACIEAFGEPSTKTVDNNIEIRPYTTLPNIIK